LSKSHRQSGDIDVAALASLVRDGDGDAALAGLQDDRFRGVAWQRGSDRALADAVLEQALPAYRAVQSAADVQAALAAAKCFRVLTAVREGGAGSQKLNGLIAGALDPARRGDGFFRGRLVLIIENSYRHQLFNGDIGVVWPDEFGEQRVWFDTESGPRAWLPAALPAHESAFVLTVHKSQGSEFERVFFALPEQGSRVVSRELLYTGLTRCRREVTLWANESVLREGIARKAQRWSGLAQRL
jgi:exodeoxyribonuclease V alpha subunit